MFGLGLFELVIVLIIVLVLFGPGKLPKLAKGLGKSIKEFKQAKNDKNDETNLK